MRQPERRRLLRRAPGRRRGRHAGEPDEEHAAAGERARQDGDALGVRSLSGYLTTAAGERMVFSDDGEPPHPHLARRRPPGRGRAAAHPPAPAGEVAARPPGPPPPTPPPKGGGRWGGEHTSCAANLAACRGGPLPRPLPPRWGGRGRGAHLAGGWCSAGAKTLSHYWERVASIRAGRGCRGGDEAGPQRRPVPSPARFAGEGGRPQPAG
jgi:hypothetical protein